MNPIDPSSPSNPSNSSNRGSLVQRRFSVEILDPKHGKQEGDFWRDRSPEERVSAVELLREQYYVVSGYTSTPRLVRELNLVERTG